MGLGDIGLIADRTLHEEVPGRSDTDPGSYDFRSRRTVLRGTGYRHKSLSYCPHTPDGYTRTLVGVTAYRTRDEAKAARRMAAECKVDTNGR